MRVESIGFSRSTIELKEISKVSSFNMLLRDLCRSTIELKEYYTALG